MEPSSSNPSTTQSRRVFPGNEPVLTEGRDYFIVEDFSPEKDLADFPTDRGLVVTYLDRLDFYYKQWRHHLPRVQVYYAVKAFNHPQLLSRLQFLGAKFDAASAAESKDCLAIGAKNTDILISHPQKSERQLQSFKILGIKLLTVDCVEELHKIAEYCPESEILIRITPAVKSQSMFKLDKKFGADTSEAEQIIKEALKLAFHVRGIGFHVGSQPTDLTSHAKSIALARQLFDYSLSQCGHKMSILNIGGGFHGANKLAEFEETSENVNAALERYFPEEDGVEIFAEPGTYFAEAASDHYACVIGKRRYEICENPVKISDSAERKTHGFHYYLNNGVYGSLLKAMYVPTMSFWADLEDRKLTEKHREGNNGEKVYPGQLWGPTCAETDLVGQTALIPELRIGDWLVNRYSGSYSLDLESRFNSMPRPIHLVVGERPDQSPSRDSHFNSKAEGISAWRLRPDIAVSPLQNGS